MRQLSLEPVTWRVRALAAGGRTVADSRAALLALRDGAPPAYAFPEADIERGALPEAAWRPLEGAPGYSLLDNAHVETFLEEDEPLAGGPRSPYHRVDALASARHVRVLVAGEILAESRRPTAVFETDEPARFYFAQADVRHDLLEPSDTVTSSPYTGSAVWFSARVGGELHPDVAWTYRFTIPQLPRIAGLLAFRDELVHEIEQRPAGDTS
ncbi:MAG TPA: DUF427 domain-containing protein [Gaiellales bacterium]|nr:DUF427 domain-containing protein [Gaiellales bacterium]